MVDESIRCMEGLLLEALELLQFIFEHGLESCFSYMEEADVMNQRFEHMGLAHGSVLWKEFYRQLEFGKLSVEWETNDICMVYSELWRYIASCQRRLDYESAHIRLSKMVCSYSGFL